MSYRIAGIDVHKKMLAVVVSDVEIESDFQFERRMFGSNPEQLRSLAAWLIEQEVEEAVMESTAQYWKPVWGALERYWKPIREKRAGARRRSGTLHLAQAQSNRGRRGRKRDFPDAERLVKRLVARELTLSFVPDAEQRLWRTVTRRKYQLTRDHVRLQNQLESLLEEAHIKLSSLVSNLLGASLLSGLILCNGFLAAAHLVEDDVGCGFPDEGLRFIVPVRQPLINRSLQFAHTKESAAADHSVGDESEKALHLIEPGTTGRCEVKVEAPPLFRLEPSLNDLAFMGGIVVHDQMHLLVRWHLFFQLVERFDELLGAMARLATANHPPIQDVEGRE